MIFIRRGGEGKLGNGDKGKGKGKEKGTLVFDFPLTMRLFNIQRVTSVLV